MPRERIEPENERLTLIFFEAYRNKFISPGWDKMDPDFRQALRDGVRAVTEELKK